MVQPEGDGALTSVGSGGLHDFAVIFFLPHSLVTPMFLRPWSEPTLPFSMARSLVLRHTNRSPSCLY